MKKFLLIFSLFLVSLISGLFYFRYFHGQKTIDETKTVYVKKMEDGFNLIRNGSPFFIKGASGNSYFKELAETGGNTIRVYDTIKIEQVLNDAFKYNLAVIVDIPIPKYYRDVDIYSNENESSNIKSNIKNLIRKYKKHPALLMWNLGNELRYPLVLRKNNFINVFNELIEIIHKEDPNHPVSTALGDLDRLQSLFIYIHSPELDLLCYNVFGGVKNIKRKLKQLSLIKGSAPYFLSEIGSDGPWESKFTSWYAPIEQTCAKKAEQIVARYKIVMGNNDTAFLGSLVFYWGNKHQVTFSWYSLFYKDYKSESIKVLNNLWMNSNQKFNLIGLDYMLVDKKGSADNIIFSPNETKLAELIFDKKLNDSLKIEWEIYPETWYEDLNRSTYIMARNASKIENLFINLDKDKVTFITPKIEGPYRIFAYIYDQKGNFATTNTPFYVLDNK